MITSDNNQTIRRVRALLRSTRRRYREQALVAEGLRVCRELLRSSCHTELVLHSSAFAQDADTRTMLDTWRGVTSVFEVSDEVFALTAGTETPQGVLAVGSIPDLRALEGPKLILIPDQIRDPGNLGTLLRTAWATGVTEVIIPPGTVDHTNPKVVRAGMGAHFYVPIHTASWEEIRSIYTDVNAWVADASGRNKYTAVDWNQDAALIVGGEAAGASAQAYEWAQTMSIPMAQGVESLNAAIAGSVILFEAFRQRSQ